MYKSAVHSATSPSSITRAGQSRSSGLVSGRFAVTRAPAFLFSEHKSLCYYIKAVLGRGPNYDVPIVNGSPTVEIASNSIKTLRKQIPLPRLNESIQPGSIGTAQCCANFMASHAWSPIESRAYADRLGTCW
jgi:hypothetical protein